MDVTETETDTIITAPLPTPGFAISATLLRRLGARLPPRGEDWYVTADMGGFLVPAYYLHFTRKAAMQKRLAQLQELAAKIGKNLVELPCTLDKRPTTLLVCEKEDFEEVHLDAKDDPYMSTERVAMLTGDRLMCIILSTITGLRVVYCHGGSVIQPPRPDKDGQITIFGHARPPGFTDRDLTVTQLFDMQVWKEGAIYYVSSPTRGRGRIVEATGKPVFQVLGSNYYQLCLTHDRQHDQLNRAKIFQRLMGALMQDLDYQAVGMDEGEEEQDADERIAGFVRDITTKDVVALRSRLREAEAQVEKLQTELAEQFKKRHELIMAISTNRDAAAQRELEQRLPAEVAGLEDIDGVAAMDIVDGGIHLRSEPVTFEEDGARYPLGPFTIRLDPLVGKVTAWSDAPRHPDGHHHPHIASHGLACFGSVSIPLLKCMAAFRFREAAELAIGWLHSYNKANTLYRLEEFPKETKEVTDGNAAG